MPVAAFTPYAAGSCGIEGLLSPAERPRGTGLYLLDNVPEGEPRHGPVDLGPAVTAAELVACGAQLLVAASDDGELAGTAVAPVVKVCADPRKTSDTGEEIDASHEGQVIDAVLGAIDGWRTSAERLGYCDFALVHKSFESALEGHR
jgi:altronate hydrolase